MPAPDSFKVCPCIRQTSRAPVLILTVHDATVDNVRALDLRGPMIQARPAIIWNCWRRWAA